MPKPFTHVVIAGLQSTLRIDVGTMAPVLSRSSRAASTFGMALAICSVSAAVDESVTMESLRDVVQTGVLASRTTVPPCPRASSCSPWAASQNAVTCSGPLHGVNDDAVRERRGQVAAEVAHHRGLGGCRLHGQEDAQREQNVVHR